MPPLGVVPKGSPVRLTDVEVVYGPPRTRITTALVVACIGLLISMAEIDRLVGNVVSKEGITRSMGDVIGFSLHPTDAWTVWSSLDGQDEMQVLFFIQWHLILDGLFITAYSFAFLLLILPKHLGMSKGRVKWGLRFLTLVIIAEIIEAAFIIDNLSRLERDDEPLVGGTQFVSDIKILFFVFLVLATLLGRDGRVRQRADALWSALKTHRVSVVSVVLLALVTLVPLPEIWDQLPDVQRTWILSYFHHLVAALIASFIFAFALLVVGRKRTERSYNKHIKQEPLTDAGARMTLSWLIAPAGAALAAVVLQAVHPEGNLVHWPSLAWFTGIPCTIVIVSLALRRWGGKSEEALKASPEQQPPTSKPAAQKIRVYTATPWEVISPKDTQRESVASQLTQNDQNRLHKVHVTWAIGDFLAISVLAISGLGLIRSLVGPLAVLNSPFSEGVELSSELERGIMAIMLVLGFALASLAFPYGIPIINKLPTDPENPKRFRKYLARVLNPQIMFSVGLRGAAVWVLIPGFSLLILAIAPLPISGVLGPAATFTLLLAAWTTIVGSVVVYAQYWKPLEIFRLLQFNRTPALTVLALMLVIPTLQGGDPRLHAIQTVSRTENSKSSLSVRTHLSEQFKSWLESSASCDRPIEDRQDMMVRPMLLTAAEGGGIRAAKWTVDVIESIGASGSCGPLATFLSSGISGGSVGLALTHVYATKPDEPKDRGKLSKAQEAVRAIAGPESLAAAVAGMFGGDIIASATGIKIPSTPDGIQGGWAWRDRAALMESAWQTRASSLHDTFTTEVKGPAGSLVLNSTAAGLGCRVMVSQQHLLPRAAGEVKESPPSEANEKHVNFQLPNCRSRDQIAATVDLFDAYPGACVADMSWATSAMLSARFPYVTPAGRVPSPDLLNCSGGKDDDLQLIDGGYAEGSGLGTIADVAPLLSEMILAHNNRVLAQAGANNGDLPTSSDSPAPRSIIVPVVLFIRNSPGSDVTAPVNNLTSEYVVPMAGLGAGKLQIEAGAWLQRIAMDLNACPPYFAAAAPVGTAAEHEDLCKLAVGQINAEVPGRVAVAAPNTVPGISPPLGWTLSQYSQKELDRGLERQLHSCKQSSRSYPCLHNILNLLNTNAETAGQRQKTEIIR